MTDTTTTDVAEAITEHALGELEHLDPNSLHVDNVRDDAALSKEFLASIAENGVLVPITGVRHPDNSDVIRVRNGSLSSSRVVVDPCGAAECCRGCDRTR